MAVKNNKPEKKAKRKKIPAEVKKQKAKISAGRPKRVVTKKQTSVKRRGVSRSVRLSVKPMEAAAGRRALKAHKKPEQATPQNIGGQAAPVVEKVAPPEHVIPPVPQIIIRPQALPQIHPIEEVKVEAREPGIPKTEKRVIEADFPVSLKDLAAAVGENPSVLIKKLLINQKVMATINQALDEELAKKIASDYGCELKPKLTEEEQILKDHKKQDITKLRPRPPIVTFMGHVDHGKTSLLDAIRKSKLAEKEFGGITQHIGAYEVSLPKGKITFLDTPGHEAFTLMRARGAKATDIVVLVVAADDGVMPQTIEAIDHARDAGVPILVAINKTDKPQANINTIKKQLAELDLSPEDWGGKTITVGVSAKTGQGIDELLEMILLEAEMLELKADPAKPASGVVLEAKITEGRGQVATLLVEDGTLQVQHYIIVGPYYAKIRAMFNEFSKPIHQAPPSCPVEVLGLSGLPEAGEPFFAVASQNLAREIAEKRKQDLREKRLRPIKILSLEDLSTQIKVGKVKELKLIVKADVSGSLEAIKESIKKIETAEIDLKIIHTGIGTINLSDVVLAEASVAVILGFNVICDDLAKQEAERGGVDVRTYNVIYELLNELKTALEGMLEPKLKKVFIGRVLVRQVLKLSRAGIVAGCYVEKGKVLRSSKIVLSRNGEKIFEGAVHSLKRFKDDVREVGEGMECGITLAGFSELMQGDIIEAYSEEKIARKL